MTAVRLPRISRPGVLESIAPERLLLCFNRSPEFFAERNVSITSPNSLDCEAIMREITRADRENAIRSARRHLLDR